MKQKLLALLLVIGLFHIKAQDYPVKTIELNVTKDYVKIVTPVVEEIGNNTIVGLGEGTHGTKEFNEIRAAISKNLITKQHFNIVCFEAPYGDIYYLNKAVNSNTDIKTAMKQYLISIWQTKEIEDFLLWIRDYNKRNKNQILLSGVDFNFTFNCVNILENEFKNNKVLKLLTDSLLLKAKYQDEMWNKQNDKGFRIDMPSLIKNGTQAYELVENIKETVRKENVDLSTESTLALENIKLGFTVMYEANKKNYEVSRDQMMAEMVIKTYQLYNNKKVIIIAHNGHVSFRFPFSGDMGMGGYLKKQFGEKYFALATLTSTGTYSATLDNIDTNDNKYKAYELPLPLKTSWQNYFSSFKNENFYLDLRKNHGNLKQNLSLALWGYFYLDPVKYEKNIYTEKISNLNDYFDGIIFLRKTNASEHLN
ncbi:erythromycin esterase [Chryseobacterium lactis]|uniref:Erythromycin esterase n=1 Tax=Chryseobacterium lactis TaxID=1241981 RepID=A0A3G6RSQ1_CHRLC|nr:erythromycin esterase family protein [Chryseobacterium lactis]AZA81026.1 erythromycin esterase [Chryseobacterium lactis]AZB06027.1 erythromycin esterase [Chryseobacterium lactis]PNW14876.1 erythromycin esterase [Chryseobacterium lactis]